MSMSKHCSDGSTCSDQLQQKYNSPITIQWTMPTWRVKASHLEHPRPCYQATTRTPLLWRARTNASSNKRIFGTFMSGASPSSPSGSSESDLPTPRLKCSSTFCSPTEQVSPKCPISLYVLPRCSMARCSRRAQSSFPPLMMMSI